MLNGVEKRRHNIRVTGRSIVCCVVFCLFLSRQSSRSASGVLAGLDVAVRIATGRFLIDNPVTIQEYRPGDSFVPTTSTAMVVSRSTSLPARTHYFRHSGLGALLRLGHGLRVEKSRVRKAVEKSLGARIVLGRSDINKHSILLQGKSPVFKNTR